MDREWDNQKLCVFPDTTDEIKNKVVTEGRKQNQRETDQLLNANSESSDSLEIAAGLPMRWTTVSLS